MSTPSASALASEKYLRLTTFTRDGRPKHTPVWVAALPDGRLGFTTELDSWKVKRITHTPSVELTPCDMRGRVADGASATAARAEIVRGDAAAAVRDAIRAKYGWQVAMINALEKLRGLVGRGRGETCGVVLAVE